MEGAKASQRHRYPSQEERPPTGGETIRALMEGEMIRRRDHSREGRCASLTVEASSFLTMVSADLRSSCRCESGDMRAPRAGMKRSS